MVRVNNLLRGALRNHMETVQKALALSLEILLGLGLIVVGKALVELGNDALLNSSPWYVSWAWEIVLHLVVQLFIPISLVVIGLSCICRPLLTLLRLSVRHFTLAGLAVMEQPQVADDAETAAGPGGGGSRAEAATADEEEEENTPATRSPKPEPEQGDNRDDEDIVQGIVLGIKAGPADYYRYPGSRPGKAKTGD